MRYLLLGMAVIGGAVLLLLVPSRANAAISGEPVNPFPDFAPDETYNSFPDYIGNDSVIWPDIYPDYPGDSVSTPQVQEEFNYSFYFPDLPIAEDLPVSNAQQNLDAFLKTIRYAEGTSGIMGYRTLFGGSLFWSYADHPRKRFYGEWIEKGKTTYTTAAGAYQITETTFNRLEKKLGTKGFTPEVQDAMAIELIREQNALEDIQTGNFVSAVDKLSGVWASLPGARVNQPRRTMEQVSRIYVQEGGSLV